MSATDGNNITRKQKAFSLWPVLLVCVLIFISYGNTLHGPFLFDDYDNIVQNGYIQIRDLSWSSLAAAAFKSPLASRPAANLSFALNFFLNGYSRPAYHLTNIAIHCLSAVFLFFVIHATFTLKSLRLNADKKTLGHAALIATLLWALNPINTQSVSYIVQRMNSMAAMFYILAVLLYIKARQTNDNRRIVYFCACAATALLAFGSKEIAATLPIAVFFYEWFFFQDLSRSWLKKKLPLIALIAIVFALVAAIYLHGSFTSFLDGYNLRDFTLRQRLLTEPRVIWLYLKLVFLPWPGFLNLDYDYQLSTGILHPLDTIFAVIGLFVLFASIFPLAKKHRMPAFAILWFFLNIAIESSFIPLEIVYEHRTYLPSMFIWPALAALALRLPGKGKTTAAAAGLVVVAVFSLWTYQRNDIWSNEVRMNRDIVKKSPNYARTHTNLGRALIYSNNQDEGLAELNKAIAIDPLYPFSYLNRGGYYLKNKLYDQAINDFRTVTRLTPGYNKVWYFLCKAEFKKQQWPETITAARMAINIPAFHREVLGYLGIASSQTGDLETALKCFREMIENDPGNARFHFNLGLALEKSGRLPQALGQYQEAMSLASEADQKIISRAMARLWTRITP